MRVAYGDYKLVMDHKIIRNAISIVMLRNITIMVNITVYHGLIN